MASGATPTSCGCCWPAPRTRDLRYALTGDHLDAQEALRIGIVNKVVPKAWIRLLDECFSIVERTMS